MTLRFVEREIAIVAIDPVPWCPFRRGDEVEVVRVGPFTGGEKLTGPAYPRMPTPATHLFGNADYEIRCPGGWHWFADDVHLRKRRPPIPEEVRDIFERAPRNEEQPA